MLALFELPGGFALFKVVEGGGYKLMAQHLFKDSAEAVEACKAIMESDMPKSLQKFLKKNIVSKEIQDKLAVQDAKLGKVIKKKLDIPCIHDDEVDHILRGIREQICDLVDGLTQKNFRQMSLGLAHTLSRHTLKFSADKIDVMVIQAIGLLDDLDKELNTYAMRVKEWYGWHFPELAKIVVDNMQYARLILLMGVRENAADLDLTTVLDEDTTAQVKDAAIHSMGVGLTEEDVANIKALCEEVLATSEYRVQLYEYLKNRMNAIAPNLTTLVGELVGARLVSHAGSLLNLAKAPASTVQILGAEKALFVALKTKAKTPKYGLIYHASLVGQASTAHKGKIARITACQSSLAARVDALTEGELSGPSIGIEGREAVELKLRKLEAGETYTVSGRGKTDAAKQEGYNKHAERATRTAETVKPTLTLKPEEKEKKDKKRKHAETEEAGEEKELSKEERKALKKARKAAKAEE
eukprot:NODE_1486_length_1718_cov_241.180564_g1409_i0.p1 GENE.NODE_1486_length_1718_cov_241.180564_g1409_i0~~NODE_1486_length_1718_cov_241.180564_g1409_i0.p1  ORF type:complete len:495 (+),score=161.68 NODE_1486_length_1718_cov_241.180564_g1409_i0:77-1486(+)